jgi:hypothetical protein
LLRNVIEIKRVKIIFIELILSKAIKVDKLVAIRGNKLIERLREDLIGFRIKEYLIENFRILSRKYFIYSFLFFAVLKDGIYCT